MKLSRNGAKILAGLLLACAIAMGLTASLALAQPPVAEQPS